MQLLSLLKELSLHPKNAEKLKGLILQLAVQGKLTKNWRESNTPKNSVEGIKKLIKEGKASILDKSGVKKEKPIEPIKDKDITFDAPESWVWSRFASTAYIVRGGSPRPIKSFITDDPNGINWIKIGDTKGVTKYIEKCEEKIIPEGMKSSRYVEPGDFILSNSMSFGKPFIMKTDGCIHDGWLLIREVKNVLDQDYLYYLLLSPYAYNCFKDAAAGGVVQNLNIEKVRHTMLPIPPLEEQKAIIEVVNQLFAEVEQLEALTKERISLKEDFVTSALRRLTETNNTAIEWNELKDKFSTFFTEKSSIKKLRESILQLSVQGKLTAKWREEHPDVEPASELLKRIEAEKQQLIKEKKIKKEALLPPVGEDEMPYELPEGWEYSRVGTVALIKGGKRVPKGYVLTDTPTPYKYIRVTDMKNGSVNLHGLKYITEEVYQQIKAYTISKDDLYITIAGTIGDVGEIPEELDGMNLTENAAKIIYYQVNKQYLKLLLSSSVCQIQFIDKVNQMAQPKLALHRIGSTIIPIPPLEEQQVIIEKVNSLMALCDELEQQIETSHTQLEQLMQSCLKEVIQ
jgi:type I restriction enzyme S subunit